MSLTKEALTYVSDMAIANTSLLDNQNPDYKGVLIPADMKLESIEQFQKYKNRFSGTFFTGDIDNFANYVGEYIDSACFIDCAEPIATAIFDRGTVEEPGHSVHRACISLSKTPEYEALLNFEKGEKSQRHFAEFLEDWKFCITCTNALSEEMETKDAIQGIRHVTIEAKKKDDVQVSSFSSNKSAMEQLDASNNGKPLPAWIIFTCSPYEGLQMRDFPLRISLALTREMLAFKATFSNFAKIRDEFQKEFMAIVKDNLDDSKVAVYLGTWNK